MEAEKLVIQTSTQSSPVVSSIAEGKDDVCSTLSGILLSGIDIHRCLAAQALGHIGGSDSVDALIKGLLDEDEDVRTDAATALARLADSKADKQLLENLIGDPCPEVKLAAMTALASTKNEEVRPWLLRILASRDEDIVWDEDEFYDTGWDDWLDMRLRAMNSLADLGVEDAVSGIVTVIKDDDTLDITDSAMKALARTGDAGLTALVDFLSDSDTRLRRHAASVLSRCDSPLITNAVNLAIQDTSSDVRLAVARGLAEKNPADKRLGILLSDSVPEIRAEAVRLCGVYHQEQLGLLLDEKYLVVQQAVLDLLAGHPELTNVEELEERVRVLLRSPAVSIAAAAAAAFATVSSEGVVSELNELLAEENVPTEVHRGVIRSMKTVGDDEALNALSEYLLCEDRQIRLDAMSTIAELASETDWPNTAGDILLATLSGVQDSETDDDLDTESNIDPNSESDVEPEKDNEEAEVTAAPIEDDGEQENLGDTEAEVDSFPTSTLDAITKGSISEGISGPPDDVEMTPEDLEFLSLVGGENKRKRTLPLVPDVVPHEDVRLFATRLLGNFPHSSVMLALLVPLSETDKELKQTAIDSLAHISSDLDELPDEALELLLVEAKSWSLDIRRQAMRTLGCGNDTSVVMTLINALDDEDSFVRIEAIRSLGRLGEAGAGVSRLLDDPTPTVRLAAAEALAQTDASDVIETLVNFAYAFEGYHGRDAARLLAKIDKQAANSLFIKMFKDEDNKRYWKVAIEALEELNRSGEPFQT